MQVRIRTLGRLLVQLTRLQFEKLADETPLGTDLRAMDALVHEDLEIGDII